MDVIQTNVGLAKRFLEAMAALDYEAMKPLITADFIIDSKGSSAFSGPRSAAELPALIQGMRGCLQGGKAKLDVLSLTANQSRVACEAKGDATTVEGKPYRNQYLFLLEVKDGKVAKCSEYMDTRLMEEVIAPVAMKLMSNQA